GWRGVDAAEAVVRLRPRDGETTLLTEEVVEALERESGSLALVLLPGVSYLTGQVLEVVPITEAAHAAGAVAGWDLAHSIGNVPVALHDSGADFAVWCHYKCVNAGPGAPPDPFLPHHHTPSSHLPPLAP